MAALEDMTDLANATLAKYGKNMMTDAMSTLQRYTGYESLMKKKKIIVDSGLTYKYTLIHTPDSNARAIHPFAVNNTDQVDGTVQGTIEFKFIESSCTFDVKQISVNDGPQRIFNFLAKNEFQMWQGYVDLMEQYFWDGPSSSSDTKVPYGLFKYWLDYSGYSSGGFEGGNHANFSSGPGGIDCSTYTRYKHWVDNYTNVSDEDLIRKMREAYVKTDFRGIPNKPVKDYSSGTGHQFGIYTNYDVLAPFEELIDSKNENLGKDLARWDGQVMFRGTPVEYVPYLEENKATSDPVVGLDWNDYKCVVLKGQDQRMTPYYQSGNQNDVRHRFLTSGVNFVMQDRRKHFLIAKSDPLSS